MDNDIFWDPIPLQDVGIHSPEPTDASTLNDDEEDSGSYESVFSGSGSSFVIQTTSTLVTLNSVFQLYGELSPDTKFSYSDLCFDQTQLGIEDRYIGCWDPSEGVVPEETFVRHFQSHGYEVTQSDLREICDHRLSGDSKTTFLIQGIAERTTEQLKQQRPSTAHPYGKFQTRGWKVFVPYMETDNPADIEDNEWTAMRWMHCIHVVPVLDSFFCPSQTADNGDLLACPFSWLLIRENSATMEQSGYLRTILHIWKVTTKKNNIITRVKRKSIYLFLFPLL